MQNQQTDAQRAWAELVQELNFRLSPAAELEGRQALERLTDQCLQHVGSSTVPIAEFLVSLYNASYAKVDAYQLCRRLDRRDFDDVLAVMKMFRDVPGQCEVHDLMPDGKKRIHAIMTDFGLEP